MSNELAVTYEVDGTDINLNPAVVLKYMIGGNGSENIPSKEMARIIMTCKARNLNPFTGDVVVTHYTGRDGVTKCSLVTTKDFFARRAEANPRYRGKDAGIIVLSKDGRPVRRDGSCVYRQLGETLLGGWCRVHVDGREPEYAEVSMEEYDQHQALWKSKPATMIRKVAVSQALREAFPNDFNGLYEPEEMGIDESKLEAPMTLEDVAEAVTHEQEEEAEPMEDKADWEEF